MNNNENNIIQGTTNVNVNPSTPPQISQSEIQVNTEQPVLEIISSQPEFIEQPTFELPKAPMNNEIPQPPTVDQSQQVVMQSQITNNINKEPVVAQQELPVQQPIPENANNITNQNSMYTTPSNDQSTGNDEELVRAYIGKNYEKITTQKLNVPAFFFTTFYMFYRKMFLYGLLVFIINLLLMNFIDSNLSLAVGVLLGAFFNKFYVNEVKKRVLKLKQTNPQMSHDELINLCAAKGGTSVGRIFLGFLAEIGIVIVTLIIMLLAGIGGLLGELFNPNNWDVTIDDNSEDENISTEGATLLEDIEFNGYSCIGESCTVNGSNSEQYIVTLTLANKIDILGDYEEYTKVNAYVKNEGSKKTIIKVEVYEESTNKDISDFKDENDLRTKLGLYSIGTHTSIFTLKSIGTPGFGISDDKSYAYNSYTFIDEKNNEYEMKHIINEGDEPLNLTEGEQYKVTFEVKEGIFGLDFEIKSIN